MKIGIIGGSGLEDPKILEGAKEKTCETPWGEPSSSLLEGTISGVEVVLLSRHGRDHSLPPTQVNNRANLHALKQAACTHLLTTTACGSLRDEIKPGQLVLPDQFIDFTRFRPISFFESFAGSELKHTPMADPFDAGMREILLQQAREAGIPCHASGTIVTIEGPRFSTRAESHMFRAWGADLINMSTAPEVILANELGIPYATIAMSTDYDCWKTDEEAVSWEAVLAVFRENVDKVIQLIRLSLPLLETK